MAENAVDAAIRHLQRRYGPGAAMRMGNVAAEPIDVISTGSLALDIALGVGGVTRDRVQGQRLPNPGQASHPAAVAEPERPSPHTSVEPKPLTGKRARKGRL
jgi:hypothetical protein